MKLIEQVPNASAKTTLRTTKDQRAELGHWLTIEIMDAIASRTPLEDRWRDCLRMVEGIPNKRVRNYPVRNAPNIEIPLGAIASEAIYSQMLDLIFQTSPVLTTRPVDKRSVKEAKALQRWINWSAENQWRMRYAAEHTFLDDCQLGTGIFYCPYVIRKVRKKTDIETCRGPEMHPLAPEDFLVPGGAFEDLQIMQWCAAGFYFTEGEVQDRAKDLQWDITGIMRAGSVTFMRSTRERLGGTQRSGKRLAHLYRFWDIYCHYDINGDGIDEDLYVVWDQTSRRVVYVDYNPFSYRPFATIRYQLRGHLFYGVGPIEMLRNFELETTEIHNSRVLNMLIANTRLWKAKTGSVAEDFEVWPNRVVELDDPSDLMGEQLGDVYPSSAEAEQIDITYAERRVGTNELANPRPSAGPAMGSRMPGITALTLTQQANRRFAAAFDGARYGLADAAKQCLYREQERLRAGDRKLKATIKRVLGERDGQMVLDILTDSEFAENYAVEVTASTASVNREADRQASIMLANLLMTYYEKAIQLQMAVANPQVPPEVQEIAKKAFAAATELMDRTLRSFDQVRDPSTFLIEVENNERELGSQLRQLSPDTVATLARTLSGTPAIAPPANGGGSQTGVAGQGIGV